MAHPFECPACRRRFASYDEAVQHGEDEAEEPAHRELREEWVEALRPEHFKKDDFLKFAESVGPPPTGALASGDRWLDEVQRSYYGSKEHATSCELGNDLVARALAIVEAGDKLVAALDERCSCWSCYEFGDDVPCLIKPALAAYKKAREG